MRGELFIEPQWEHPLRQAGLATLHAWQTDERISVWRDLRERQNAVVEVAGPDGVSVRLHVKRLKAGGGERAADEVAGVRLLEEAGIPTAALVAWGERRDGSGVLVTADLAGCAPGDVLLREWRGVERLLEPTARLAARLHSAGLHHRDLYLCHFLVDRESPARVHLIDAARVRRLPRWPGWWRRRWMVKDLAQFRFSVMSEGVDEAAARRWLEAWAANLGEDASAWEPAVRRKAMRIARHDARLAERRPERHVGLESLDGRAMP